jgi:hypothetical protein
MTIQMDVQILGTNGYLNMNNNTTMTIVNKYIVDTAVDYLLCIPNKLVD